MKARLFLKEIKEDIKNWKDSYAYDGKSQYY